MRTTLRGLGVIVPVFLYLGCSSEPSVVRPEGVAENAIYVAGGGKVGGWWQECKPVKGQGPHCRIWNRSGLLLWDEEFLPYDQGPTPTPEETKIPARTWFPGPDRVCLGNGRILFPRTKFEELKQWLDELNKAGQGRKKPGETNQSDLPRTKSN